MKRSHAHDLMGRLATFAWENKKPFVEVVLANEEVIRRITDPFQYIVESKIIIKTLAKKNTIEKKR